MVYDESIHFGGECLHLIFVMFVYQSVTELLVLDEGPRLELEGANSDPHSLS